MVRFISLMMMICGLWKTARASSSGASFISLHRYRHDATNLVHTHQQSLVHHFHSSSSALTLVDHLPRKSLHSNNRRIRPHKSYLQLSSTRSTTTTTSQTDTSDDHVHDSHVELKPFNWAQLRDLFRSPTITDSGIILGNNSNNQQEEHYIPSDHPNLALFRRSLAAQEEYEIHNIDLINNNFKSAYDYLVMDKFGKTFGFEKVREEDSSESPNNGYVYKVSPSLAEASQYTISNQLTYLRLVLNDFPYDVEENIEHWCLWKIGGKCSKEGILREELSWAVKELQCLHAADTTSGSSCILDKNDKMLFYECESEEISAPIADMLYWVNPPHLQSMPNIHHAHMLVIRSDL